MPPRLLRKRYVHPGSERRTILRRSANATVLQLALVCVASVQSSSQHFPETRIVLDMAVLSNAVYHLRNKVQSCHDAQSRNRTLIDLFHGDMARKHIRGGGNHSEAEDLYRLLLPEGTECLHYSHDHSLGTQVLVVRSSLHKYVAVAYAGTDDWRTALMDGDVLTSDFGPGVNSHFPADDVSPVFRGVPEGVRVHRGFNSAVFDTDDFQPVMNCISSARLGGNCSGNSNGRLRGTKTDTNSPSTPYRLFTTGHSLGAADSVLLGATLHLTYPNERMTSINFGCPKVGNTDWSFWMDSLQPDKGGGQTPSAVNRRKKSGSFEIFRFVNKIDLVPRLPELVFTHAGHTLQMSAGGEVKAYYDHLGNDDLGYAGVPFGWEAAPYALLPFAIASHSSKHYVKYLTSYQPNSNLSDVSTYVHDFERVEGHAQVSSYA